MGRSFEQHRGPFRAPSSADISLLANCVGRWRIRLELARSNCSSNRRAGPVEDTWADRPVGAGAGSLEDQELELAREMVRQARASGVALTGPGGLLKSVTKLVIETALEEAESRAPGIRQARGRGPQPGQLPQWQAVQDGADRRGGRRGDRGPQGSGGASSRR